MIKKMVFTAAIVGTFAAGMVMSINDSEAKKVISNNYDCYSASSGSNEGAWFYDCSDCRKVAGVHSGSAGSCSN